MEKVWSLMMNKLFTKLNLFKWKDWHLFWILPLFKARCWRWEILADSVSYEPHHKTVISITAETISAFEFWGQHSRVEPGSKQAFNGICETAVILTSAHLTKCAVGTPLLVWLFPTQNSWNHWARWKSIVLKICISAETASPLFCYRQLIIKHNTPSPIYILVRPCD